MKIISIPVDRTVPPEKYDFARVFKNISKYGGVNIYIKQFRVSVRPPIIVVNPGRQLSRNIGSRRCRYESLVLILIPG